MSPARVSFVLSLLAIVASTLAMLLASRAIAQTSSVEPSNAHAAHDTRFVAYDVLVDSGSTPLAAWQVEIVDRTGRAKLVGVEGGEPAAFAEAPRYDPRALAHERVVLAAFSTETSLPTGRSRVARVHVAVEGAADPELVVRAVVAATADGARIDARAEIARL